ncbi:coiled-coil domain-containing protein 172 [Thamnophis elegans]|uniref:coiled-coil domain-containing protein 172 n=1 Tax=Thamnophis elegans TaxID=35005 RepID=UPI001377473D|nr:coiled-coil domain-containing protein 172 [Thamnophis elegans]
MNLDSLFQQIFLVEQKAEEKRCLMHQVKQEISKNHEKANEITQQLGEEKQKLEIEAQLLSEKLFNLELFKKRKESLEKQKADLLSQKNTNLEAYKNLKTKIAEEDETFLKEIKNFNNEYGLILNRELVIKKRAQTEIGELDQKESLLRKEIESMEHETIQLKIFHLQKNELKQDLSTLQRKLRDFEKKLAETKSITNGLELEKITISEKLQTDPEYIRLKKQLENYKEDETENACEALQMEIEFLQMELLQKKSSVK